MSIQKVLKSNLDDICPLRPCTLLCPLRLPLPALAVLTGEKEYYT